MKPPVTQYVDGVNIAYQRFGAGSPILVYTPPWVSNVELSWDIEEHARVAEVAAQFNDIVTIDKRGMGLSDRTNEPPTLDHRVDDVIAVMDAEGIKRAAMIGMSEGAMIALAVAAHHPDRAACVVLVGPATPGLRRSDLEPFVEPGDAPLVGPQVMEEIIRNWGTAGSVTPKWFAPEMEGNARWEAWSQRFERLSASPGALAAHLLSSLTGDVRDHLDIACPIFLGHCRGDRVVPVATTRWLAAQLPGATVKIWEDDNHVWQTSPSWRTILADITEFTNGSRPAPSSSSRFGVVLFTDIVDSTRLVGEQGDADWARLIRAHDAAADRVIGDHDGRRVKSTGDGLLAVFTDPERAVRAARRLADETSQLGVTIRAGVHAGQVEHHADGDITGIAVNLASRIEATARPGSIHVSSTVRDLLVGSTVTFDGAGAHDVKGFDSPIDVYRAMVI